MGNLAHIRASRSTSSTREAPFDWLLAVCSLGVACTLFTRPLSLAYNSSHFTISKDTHIRSLRAISRTPLCLVRQQVPLPQVGGHFPFTRYFVLTELIPSSVIMFPLETLKTRKAYLQVQEKSLKTWPPSYSIIQMTRDVLREEGLRGVYRGVGGAVIEAIPSSGLTFMAFEFVERSLGKPKKEISFFEHFVSGCIASAFSQSFTFPLQNIRKMVQTGYVPVGTADLVRRIPNPNWVDVVRSLVRSSGFMGAWKGSMANLLAHAPYTGLIFASFELLHSLATGQDPPPLPKPAAEVVAAIQKEVNDIRSPS
jgi:hypothetical protein